MNNLSNIEKGYIAGIIDGKGTISIYKRPIYTNPKTGYASQISYDGYIRIYNDDAKMLWNLKSTMGVGNLKCNKRGEWELHLSANPCRELLPQIIDTLQIKQLHALLLSEFLEITMRGPRSEDVLVRQEEIYQNIKKLNVSGRLKKEYGLLFKSILIRERRSYKP